jgi:hypothetical protein
LPPRADRTACAEYPHRDAALKAPMSKLKAGKVSIKERLSKLKRENVDKSAAIKVESREMSMKAALSKLKAGKCR